MMRARTRGKAWAIGSAVLLTGIGATGTGCVTAIGIDEIPPEPIAFVYYDAETTRKRFERLSEAMSDDGEVSSAGIAEVDKVAKFIKDTIGMKDEDPVLQGRLALLDPHTREVSVVAGARKGAVPQDWSPDHKRLLFTQVVRSGRPQLFELDVETGQVGPKSHGREAHPEGCYGPNGSVVYTSVDPKQRERNARIVLYDPLVGRPRQISGPGYAYFPTCATDGSAVAYSRIPTAGGRQQIVVRSFEPGAEERVLTSGKDAAFSPDGSLIAFSAQLKGDWVLWRIRPDGTGRQSLGHGGFDERRPNLSPDNRLVIYVADTVTNQRLFMRRVDGSGDRLFFSDGDGDRPIW